MKQIHSIVAELRAIVPELVRLSRELKTGRHAHSAATLVEHSQECSLMADLLEASLAAKDGGASLRAAVSTADERTLMSAAMIMVMSYELFPYLELSGKLRDLSERIEAVMWQLDKLG